LNRTKKFYYFVFSSENNIESKKAQQFFKNPFDEKEENPSYYAKFFENCKKQKKM